VFCANEQNPHQFLSEPQLLILDEATSALDHDNERKIQQALE